MKKKLNEKLITYFDLSQPTGIGIEDGYIKFINDIFKKRVLLVREDLRENIDELLEMLSERNEKLIRLFYGINDERKTARKIAKEFNMSYQRFYEIKKKTFNIILKSNKLNKVKESIFYFETEKDELLKACFENNDISNNLNSEENKAIKLLVTSYEIKIDNLDFSLFDLYLEQVNKMHEEIENLNIDDKTKEYLFDKLDEKRREFENKHQKEIIDIYEVKINKVTMHKTSSKTLNTKISKLGLSVRAYNYLSRAGINTIEDFISKSDEELMKVRNLGKKLFDEIKEKIEEYGCLNKREIEFMNIDELELEIQNLEIDDTNKEKLLDKLNNKKSEIKGKWQQEIIKTYEEKIEKSKDFIVTGDILNIEISDLNLSARAHNGLNRESISTVGDLVNRSEKEAMKIRNLGEKTFNEIMKEVRTLGLNFLSEEDIESGKKYISIEELIIEINNLDIDNESKLYLLEQLPTGENQIQNTKYDNVNDELSQAIQNLQTKYDELSIEEGKKEKEKKANNPNEEFTR